MKEWESEHYVFHFGEGSTAEREIEAIAAEQETCFRAICRTLKTGPLGKIHYYLCETPEEVGRAYGDNEPCNAFAARPDRIYAVYNENLRCIGFHEDVHLISERIGHPEPPAVREGLAMAFDRKWWGVGNLDWTAWFLKTGRYIPFPELLDRHVFFAHSDALTYPIVGAFTEWLIFTYGLKAYLDFYQAEDSAPSLLFSYGLSAAELDREFCETLRLLRIDPAVEARMQELFEQNGVD